LRIGVGRNLPGMNGVTNVPHDWFLPVIYLSDKNTTLAVAVAKGYADPQGNVLVTLALAGSVMFLLPIFLLFLVGQKYLMEGVVTSGLKG